MKPSEQKADIRNSETIVSGPSPDLSSLPETSSPSPTRKATGPRTITGKQRSRFNAVKSGIFAKVPLLKGESPTKYRALLTSLRENLRAEGALEITLVENLTMLLWRKRRLLQAERAEIAEAVEFRTLDSISTRSRESWDRMRAGETAGGMLRPSSNFCLIHEAKEALMLFRHAFEAGGFSKDVDPWILRKLYGLDHDNQAPLGISRLYLVFSKLANQAPEEGASSNSPDELKKEMLQIFDKEIEQLKFKEQLQQAMDARKSRFEAITALIPSEGAIDRIVRYEAHLTREFDRVLNQLERLQRIRLGQPGPPTVRLELSK